LLLVITIVYLHIQTDVKIYAPVMSTDLEHLFLINTAVDEVD